MTSTPQFQLDLDIEQLDSQEQAWLRAAEMRGRGDLIRELEPGVCYIELSCIGRLQRIHNFQVPRWIIVLPIAAGVPIMFAASAGLSGIGLILLGFVAVAAMFGIATAQILRGRGKTERWTRDGHHGVLLTPDAMVLRRPASVSRIARGGVLAIEDRTEAVDPHENDKERLGERVLTERIPVRRVVGRVSDGRSQFTVVFDEAQGRPQVLGASHGLTEAVRARMDTVIDRLQRWRNNPR